MGIVRTGWMIAAVRSGADLPRWALWLAFWLVFFLGCNMAVALADEEKKMCDLEALKNYPLAYAAGSRANPITISYILADDPNAEKHYLDTDYRQSAEAGAFRQQALERSLEQFPAAERSVLMLIAGDAWTSFPDVLLAYFTLPNSVHIDKLLSVLDSEGLSEHAALLREGKALFGPDYGTEKQRAQRWVSADYVENKAFARQFEPISARYKQLPRLLDEALKRIDASPELKAIYEKKRDDTDEDDRLAYLTGGIFSCVDPYDDVDAVISRLAALPRPYSQIMVVKYFEDEMLNGSVHQAFFNSSGNIMPEVEAALTDWGLTEHAAAVRKGIAMFPTPYPRDIEKRRNFMATKGEDFDTALYELTGPVDDGAMHEAMIRVARENDILPK